ncbi:MAG: HAMP domain-containing sensor histidine kinase [Candidatus Poribacteria bacterium]|nr:HAMP domain-containing sensor histidine kinase [Candidatus Poribacteria bacterium]
MFFRRDKNNPASYTASKFLLTYFIVGLLILTFAFVYYTKQILQLNRDLDAQVPPLADLASELPGIHDMKLAGKLKAIFRESLSASRLSFILTDAETEEIVIVLGVDEEIDRKFGADGPPALSPSEELKLRNALQRMKKNIVEPKEVMYSLKDRKLYAYLYYGEGDGSAVTQIPFVLTDVNDNPQKWEIWGEWMTTENATQKQYANAERLVQNSKALNFYVPLQTHPDLRKGYFYYGKTPYHGLIIMPIVLALVFFTFLAVGLLCYQRIQSFERAAIWGGLAKETAHQLGTPISSLMGWIELLRERGRESADESTTEVYLDMQNDLVRLRKIADRLGTIGTYPSKSKVDINSIIDVVVTYFRKRLPHRTKQIEIRVATKELPHIRANADLLQWVFENLIRNSLDAMEQDVGLIEIAPTFDKEKRQIVIRYKDNGSGIERKNRRKIFRPGMTTKKHGWGLGLTLAHRIIKEYHHGQIRLTESNPSGTTFELVLPVESIPPERVSIRHWANRLEQTTRWRLKRMKMNEEDV